jgi:hypothetical protein
MVGSIALLERGAGTMFMKKRAQDTSQENEASHGLDTFKLHECYELEMKSAPIPRFAGCSDSSPPHASARLG